MLATDAEADLRRPIPPRPRAEEAEFGCGVETDELAPARGILLGAAVGFLCLCLLAAVGWWLF